MKKVIEFFKYLSNHEIYNIVFIIPFAVFIILYGNYSRKKDRDDLEKNGCYTIAKTVGTHFQYKSGMKLDYEYYFKGIKYSDCTSLNNENVIKDGGFYLIYISKSNPSNNNINLGTLVTESEFTTLPYGKTRFPCDCEKDSFLLYFNKW